MKDNADLKHRLIVAFSILMIGTAGNAFTPFAPSIIGALVDYLDYSLETAGRLASLEFWATSLGTVASTLYLHRPGLNLKRIALVCICILVICNIATTFAYGSLAIFSACRFLSGFVAGITWCTAAIAVTRVRDVERTTAVSIRLTLFYGRPGVVPAAHDLPVLRRLRRLLHDHPDLCGRRALPAAVLPGRPSPITCR